MSDKERCAVPEGVEWPRFDDGTPVAIGDTVEDEFGAPFKVESMEFFDGACTVYGDVSHYHYLSGETMRRAHKPVLDRDGVPIEVGDTVYSAAEGDELYGDEPLEVVRVNTDPDDHKPVEIRTKERYYFRYPSHHLTHERPDSWERLEVDAGKGACGYFGSEYCECGGCPHEMDPDCNVVMARDIVRRAKALAGVVGDE